MIERFLDRKLPATFLDHSTMRLVDDKAKAERYADAAATVSDNQKPKPKHKKRCQKSAKKLARLT